MPIVRLVELPLIQINIHPEAVTGAGAVYEYIAGNVAVVNTVITPESIKSKSGSYLPNTLLYLDV